MRRYLILLTTYILLIVTFPVSAHIVESDNTVGAVMHVDPGDIPVAQEPSTILFEFKDTRSVFSLDDCECFLTIDLAGNQILQTAVKAVSEQDKLSSAIPITFPEKGIYSVRVSGKPKEDIDFKAFELTYQISVEPKPVPQTDSKQKEEESWFKTHTVHLFGGLVVFFFLIFALIKQAKDQKKD